MRIAIDVRSLTDERLTGVGFYTLQIVHEIAKHAPEDDIMLFASGTERTLRRLPPFPYKNVEVVEIMLPNRLLSLLLLLPVPLVLEHFLPRTPDVWFFPNHNVIKTKRPYALTVHDLSFDIVPRFFTLKNRAVLSLSRIQTLAQNARRLFAVSGSTAFDLETRWAIPASRITVTPLGVDHARYTHKEQPSDKTFRAAYDLNQPYILCVSTKEPRKNLESVIEGYDAYRVGGGKPYPLVIIGGNGWKMRPIERARKKALFTHDIRFLGYVPEKHKPALYRGACAFLFPSFYEGFGLPVLEAMACGVPVVTSMTSSLPELVKDAGILIDPFNVNDISRALSLLFDEAGSAETREILKKKGITYAKAYRIEDMAEKTLAALRKIPNG